MTFIIRGKDQYGNDVMETIHVGPPRPAWPWYRHLAIRIANMIYPNLAYRLGLTRFRRISGIRTER